MAIMSSLRPEELTPKETSCQRKEGIGMIRGHMSGTCLAHGGNMMRNIIHNYGEAIYNSHMSGTWQQNDLACTQITRVTCLAYWCNENMMGNIYNSHMSGNDYIIFEVAMISPHSDYKQTLTSPDVINFWEKLSLVLCNTIHIYYCLLLN